jgi:hypothetical protein
MNCQGCGCDMKYIKSGSGICTICERDIKIIMSVSEVKKTYRLNENDIENVKKYTIRKQTKYLRKDIHACAQKITESLPSDDKRKIAYTTQQQKYKTEKDKNDSIVEYKNMVKNTLYKLAAKFDVEINDTSKKIIDDYLKYYGYAPKLFNEINFDEMLIHISAQYNIAVRTTQFQEILLREIDAKYHHELWSGIRGYNLITDLYKRSIANPQLHLSACQQIKEMLIKQRELAERKEQLNILIAAYLKLKHINQYNIYTYQRNYITIYNAYVIDNRGTIEECFEKIKESIDTANRIIIRQEQLNNLIKKNFEYKYHTLAYTSVVYNTYITSTDMTAQQCIAELKKLVDAKEEYSKRELLVVKNVPTLRTIMHMENDVKKLYDDYINGRTIGQMDDATVFKTLNDMIKNANEFIY